MGLKKIAANALVCAMACLAVTAISSASTLSTNYAEVFVDNLKIGGIYNLTETASYPMWVGYSGDVPVELSFASVIPSAAELKAGYEPIPDASWITISKKNASLLPDETMTLDITISVPNDGKYLGKKYQAYILTTSVPSKGQEAVGMAFALALKGRILFKVASKAATADELKELNRKKIRESQGVIVTPERFEVSASSTDKKVVITQDVPLKVINPSSENVMISLEAVDPQPNGISIPRGYVKGNTEKLAASKSRFSLKKDGIMNVEIKIDLKGNAAEKLFYVLKILIKSGTLEVSKHVRIYIN